MGPLESVPGGAWTQSWILQDPTERSTKNWAQQRETKTYRSTSSCSNCCWSQHSCSSFFGRSLCLKKGFDSVSFHNEMDFRQRDSRFNWTFIEGFWLEREIGLCLSTHCNNAFFSSLISIKEFPSGKDISQAKERTGHYFPKWNDSVLLGGRNNEPHKALTHTCAHAYFHTHWGTTTSQICLTNESNADKFTTAYFARRKVKRQILLFQIFILRLFAQSVGEGDHTTLAVGQVFWAFGSKDRFHLGLNSGTSERTLSSSFCRQCTQSTWNRQIIKHQPNEARCSSYVGQRHKSCGKNERNAARRIAKWDRLPHSEFCLSAKRIK